MKDFDKQLEQYSQDLANTHCPYSDEELNRIIRHVIWNTPSERAESLLVEQPGHDSVTWRHRWWSLVAAAAVVAIAVPVVLVSSRAHGTIDSVVVDGQQFYFACNNHCMPEGTIAYFNSIVK